MSPVNINVTARRPNTACPACRAPVAAPYAWSADGRSVGRTAECDGCGARYHAECDDAPAAHPCGCAADRSWLWHVVHAVAADRVGPDYRACETIERDMLDTLRRLDHSRWGRRYIFSPHAIRETLRASLGESVTRHAPGIVVVRNGSVWGPTLLDEDELDAEIESATLDAVAARLRAVASVLDGLGDVGDDEDVTPDMIRDALDDLDERLDDVDRVEGPNMWDHVTSWRVADAGEAVDALRVLGPDAAGLIADWWDAPGSTLRAVARILGAPTTHVNGRPRYSRRQRAALRRCADQLAARSDYRDGGPLAGAVRVEVEV